MAGQLTLDLGGGRAPATPDGELPGLLPCPFCGSDYVELHGAYRTDRAEVRAWVRCESCGAEMHEYPPRHLVRGIDESTGIVVRHWNSRAENIVHCRDCVHWRRPSDRERSRCTGAMAFVEPTPDGFCAWGERREEC